MSHEELVKIAHRWLLNQHCSVVLSEISSAATVIPDAIGWKAKSTIMVECKVSRADFHADKQKSVHLGALRYYMAPEGVLKVDDIPERWGLLEPVEGRVRVRKQPEGIDRRTVEELREEACIIVSALRRVKQREFLSIVPSLTPAAGSIGENDAVVAARKEEGKSND